jgi:membrane-associated protease RseP (regulator of RpoE activity)
MDQSQRQRYAAPLDRGVLVTNVATDSAAAKAGMVSGDVLLRIDRREIRSLGDVYRALAFFDPGETVEVEVLRDGENQVLEATFGGRMPRTGMPPFSLPFNHPNVPQRPPFSMTPPQRWPHSMEEFHDFMQTPPQKRQSGSGKEKSDQRMSL